jgi:NAD+ diphosphatase
MTGGNWVDTDWVFIGTEGEIAIFAVALNHRPDLPDHEKFIDLRSVALQVGADEFSDMPSLLGRGKMLLEWNGRRHYCSCCGHKTKADRGGYVRKCVNKICGAEHFPRTDPVVIMLVIDGDKCLLGRGKGWPEGNYSALAGFMEPGETIEEATRREVFEEAGIKVGRVTYIRSQPWPFPSSLMIGVRAEALSTEITLDTDELVEALWMDKKKLRHLFETGGDQSFNIPPKIAIARHLLEEWLQQD